MSIDTSTKSIKKWAAVYAEDGIQTASDLLLALVEERDSLRRTVIMQKSAYDCVSSLLLSVQKDCIELRKAMDQAKSALEPLADKYLWPDDLGFEYAEDIRADEDWDEDSNESSADDVFITRRAIRNARKVLGKD